MAVHCAGPFHADRPEVLQACLDAGCHYVDINDDPKYARLVCEHSTRFAERRLVAVHGCSSLPGISGALAKLASEGGVNPTAVRVTLFIGNDNPKGTGAVTSLIAGLGKPVQGARTRYYAGGQPERVPLASPFGHRTCIMFSSPDYDILPKLLGTSDVRVKVGFELASATWAMHVLARMGSSYGRRTVGLLRGLNRLVPRFGCSGGAVQADLFYSDGTVRSASIASAKDGQRMAALPAAVVARALVIGTTHCPGATTAFGLLGHRELLEAIASEGFELRCQPAS
jgi:hypothetical protein